MDDLTFIGVDLGREEDRRRSMSIGFMIRHSATTSSGGECQICEKPTSRRKLKGRLYAKRAKYSVFDQCNSCGHILGIKKYNAQGEEVNIEKGSMMKATSEDMKIKGLIRRMIADQSAKKSLIQEHQILEIFSGTTAAILLCALNGHRNCPLSHFARPPPQTMLEYLRPSTLSCVGLASAVEGKAHL